MASTLHNEWNALKVGTKFRHREWGTLLMKTAAGKETSDITDISNGVRGPMAAYLDINIPLMDQIDLFNTDVKYFEVRDKATTIPVMAVKLDDRYLTRRAGFAATGRYILLVNLPGMNVKYDPYCWGNRTLVEAHKHILAEWDKLHDNQVIDVEFILGETQEPKRSESHESVE